MSIESDRRPQLLGNRYALSNTSRHGGQAVVTQAYDSRTSRVVAIKRVRFGRPILNAIVFGQKKRIAHRDIKPKNILLTESEVPKLADYGIAKLLDSAGGWAPFFHEYPA